MRVLVRNKKLHMPVSRYFHVTDALTGVRETVTLTGSVTQLANTVCMQYHDKNLPASTYAAKREVRWSCKNGHELQIYQGQSTGRGDVSRVALIGSGASLGKKEAEAGSGRMRQDKNGKTVFPERITITVKSNKAEIRFAYPSSVCVIRQVSVCHRSSQSRRGALTSNWCTLTRRKCHLCRFHTQSPLQYHLARLQPNASAVFQGFLWQLNKPLLTCASLATAEKQDAPSARQLWCNDAH